MTDRYKVTTGTIIAGQYFDENDVITDAHQIPQDDLDAAVAGKLIEKQKEEASEEKTDAAPSLTTAHHTKRVVPADTAADKKAAKEG